MRQRRRRMSRSIHMMSVEERVKKVTRKKDERERTGAA